MLSPGWNHNIHYHDFILSLARPDCRRALDVGCGQGLLARQLAQHCREVVAIDIDRDTISQAKASGGPEARIKFVEGDVMTYPFSDDSFDLITAVATLHHLQLRPALARFQKLLRPGGVLAIIGLYRGGTLRDRALAPIAFSASWMLRLVRGYTDVGAPVQGPRETLQEIQRACDLLLPEASLRRRLLFRYSLAWRKPSV
jgi:ubiquinone/menaquinone biosynthesis C-methylase UbiE